MTNTVVNSRVEMSSATPASCETGREFRRRQIQQMLELLADAHLFMEPETAERFERNLHGQLKTLTDLAASRVPQAKSIWHQAHKRLELELRERRQTHTVVEMI